MTMNSVKKTYNIETPVVGELNLAGYGTVTYSFEAGTATAATLQDEAVLEHLASVGLATEAVASTTKKTSAKPASEPTTKE